jgi:hypothetical protein
MKLILSLVLTIIISTNGFSQYISHDSTFKLIGVIDSVHYVSSEVNAKNLQLTIQYTGKSIVGYSYVPSASNQRKFRVVRYLNNGELDASFGVNGEITSVDSAVYLNVVAIKAFNGVGFFVVVNYENGMGTDSVRISRYLEDGAIDSSFHGNGFLTLMVNNDNHYDFIAKPDGGFYLTEIAPGDAKVWSYLASGNLDYSFSGSGMINNFYSGTLFRVSCTGLMSNGTLILCGRNATMMDYRMQIIGINRLGNKVFHKVGGSLPIPFDFLDSEGPSSVVETAEHEILISVNGAFMDSADIDHTYSSLVKLDAAGNVVSSFGDAGVVYVPEEDMDGRFVSISILDGTYVLTHLVKDVVNPAELLLQARKVSKNGVLDSLHFEMSKQSRFGYGTLTAISPNNKMVYAHVPYYESRLGIGRIKISDDKPLSIRSNTQDPTDDFDLTIFPNPANETCEFRFSLAGSGHVSIEVFNQNGVLVAWPMRDSFLSKGGHSYSLPISGYVSGVYYMRITQSSQTHVTKMMVQ